MTAQLSVGNRALITSGIRQAGKDNTRLLGLILDRRPFKEQDQDAHAACYRRLDMIQDLI